MDQDKVTGMVFIDFRKAFDVMDDQLLLTRLRLYRMSDSALSWFKSYLTDRSQFVTIDGEQASVIGARSCTVPVICERYSIAPVSFLNRHFC